MSQPVYRSGLDRKKSPSPVIGMLVMVAFIFFLLPFTQLLESFTDDTKVRETGPPPPPPPEIPPEEEPPPPEEEEPPPPPEMQEPPPPVSLTDLQVSLSVGPGGFGSSFGLANFETRPNTVDEMVFELKDLDRVPKAIKRGALNYPFELKRERIEGSVKLLVLINEEGEVRVLDVVESTHRAFEKPAIEAAEDSLFESPRKNGEKVKVKFFLPIRFSLSNL
ncbi:MAG: energy transducer TonB [Opitutales bacterium]